MAIWDKARDASVDARRKDEEHHARAMHEIQSGHRRDGLWAKAVVSSAGDEVAAKLVYFKLLVQAIRDDDHVAMRSGQASKEIHQKPPISPPTLAVVPAQKPGLVKALGLWLLVLFATLVIVFGFVPLLIAGEASVVQWIIAAGWLSAIYYALNRLYP